MFAQEATLSLAAGRTPFSNKRFSVSRAVAVAYFSEEDPERLFATRMQLLTTKTVVPTNFFPFVRQGLTFDTKEGQNAILDRLRESRARVAVFDPLRSFTAETDKGPSDLAPVARFLRRVQDDTEAKTIVLIHHDVKPLAISNRSAGRSRSQQASGGGVFSLSDCPVSFRKIAWNRVAVFPEDYKFSGDPEPFEVLFETEEWTDDNGAPRFGTWVRPVLVDKIENEVDARGDDRRARILAAVRERPCATTRDILDAVKGRSAETRAVLRMLVTDRLILRHDGPSQSLRHRLTDSECRCGETE